MYIHVPRHVDIDQFPWRSRKDYLTYVSWYRSKSLDGPRFKNLRTSLAVAVARWQLLDTYLGTHLNL